MATRERARRESRPGNVRRGGMVTDSGGRPVTDEGGRPVFVESSTGALVLDDKGTLPDGQVVATGTDSPPQLDDPSTKD